MKYTVMADFLDKGTGRQLKKGSTVEVTEKRCQEINSAGYGTLLEERDEPKKGAFRK